MAIKTIYHFGKIAGKMVLPVLCLISFCCFSQQETKIDSLEKKIRFTKEDTTKVKLLNSLSWQLTMTSSLEDAKTKANLALALAQKIDFKKGIAEAHNNIGFAYELQGNYPAALKEFYTSLRISEEAGDKKAQADLHSNLAVIYNDQKNYSELMKTLQKALKLYKETNNKHGMASMYSNIANAYVSQKKNAKALIEYSKALKIYKELGDKRFVSLTYNTIGNVYNFQRKYNEALSSQLMALRLREELKDKFGMAGTHNNIAIIYEHKRNFEKALQEYTTAEKIYTEIGSKSGMADACIFIGNLKNKMNNPKEGKELFLKGIALLKEIGDKNRIKNGYKGITSADSTLTNFKGAFENHKMYILYRDSLINEENIKKTVKVQMEYTFDKKEAATRLEQEKKDFRQRNIRNSIITSLGGTLIFLIVVYRQRNKISKARKRSDELLLNILPEEVADELKKKGSADAKHFDQVTVMFTDFKGFTQISEKLTPTELVAEIHTCFKGFDNIIDKYNVEKIKTIGDAYMCVGGLPVINTTNAIDVVNAAIEIHQFMQQHLQQRQKENKDPFEIRIGIHTGPVVAGIVGVKKFAYDIWGDTVNTASRMESSGEAGKINISGSTYELVKDKFTCTYRGKVQAKNKGEIDMYFVDTKS